jgi:hypothetical protein
MPFGYKIGPSIFQRVMQNILAPFLWIFALVYIDDIMIFSLTFEDHVNNLDQVFQVIQKSGVTLAITKCHFGYQSVLLLGQKVYLLVKSRKNSIPHSPSTATTKVQSCCQKTTSFTHE